MASSINAGHWLGAERRAVKERQPMATTEQTLAEAGVADRMVVVLRERIAEGQFPVGSRLPSERDLAEQLGVSRTSIRHALQALEGQGVLETRGRSGTYVRAPSPGQVSDALMQVFGWSANPLTIRDLLEVRGMLEVDLAGFAAERRTRDDLRAITRTLADSAITLSDTSDAALHAWCVADVDFHAAVAGASHNPLVSIIFGALHDVYLEQRMRTVGAHPETRERSFYLHQAIFDCIVAGNAPGARAAMRSHLDEAREVMLRYVSERDHLLPPRSQDASPEN
jgi:DNA-binding FadR family transcriptional regulator